MFDNIGGKIKILAQVFCWTGIVASVIGGIIWWVEEEFFIGLLIMVLGSLVSWVSSFTLYGFGVLVENSETSATNMCAISKMIQNSSFNETSTDAKETKETPKSYYTAANKTYAAVNKTYTAGSWVCKKCGSKNEAKSQFCKDCGQYR